MRLFEKILERGFDGHGLFEKLNLDLTDLLCTVFNDPSIINWINGKIVKHTVTAE